MVSLVFSTRSRRRSSSPSIVLLRATTPAITQFSTRQSRCRVRCLRQLDSYKAGVVFLAWIAGHQTHFRMIGGMESARSILHYAELFRLADQARLYPDPEQAAWRMRQFCAVNGVLQ